MNMEELTLVMNTITNLGAEGCVLNGEVKELKSKLAASQAAGEFAAKVADDLLAEMSAQEPVAFVVTGYEGISTRKAFITKEADAVQQHKNWLPLYDSVEITKLYASPVAQQKVVMPNRMTDGAADYAYARYSAGWNACLDEFESLNGGKP